MTRWLSGAAVVAVALYAALVAAIYAGQRHLLFLPDMRRPEATKAGVPGLQTVELTTADGLRLLAWWLPSAPGNGVVAYFHGNGGNLDYRTDRLQLFAAAGLGILMPEYRGYGGNSGSPGEAGFAMDAAAAMQFLADAGVPPSRIAVYGESIGTGVAVRVAAERVVGAVVLESPYTSIADIARRRFWFLPVDLLLKDRFDSLSRIGSLKVPLLVIQGARDVIVPPELGQTLFVTAPEPKRIWVAPEAGHNDLMQFGAGSVATGFIMEAIRP